MEIFSDAFRFVIIVITLYVQFSHGLIEVNMDKEKHGEFFLDFFFLKFSFCLYSHCKRLTIASKILILY